MSFAYEDPAKLWLLLLLIPLVISARVLLNSFTPLKRRVSVVVRCALVTLIVLSLAQLAMKVQSRKVAVIAVTDSSSSVNVLAGDQSVGLTPDRTRRLPASQAAAEFVREATQGAGPEDLVGLVEFDRRARVIRMPAPGPLPEAISIEGEDDGSAIADALKLAAAIVPPDATGRIVLISDGNETSGDARAIAKELILDGRSIPVDVVPIRYEIDREIIVTSLDAPSTAPEAGAIPLRVVIESTGIARGVLRVTDEGTPLVIDTRGSTAMRVELIPGENVIRLEARVREGRIHRFEAIFEPEVGADGRMIADTRPENNKAQAFTLTPGAGAVLIVRSIDAPLSGTPLEGVFAEARIGFRVIPSGELPRDPLEYRNYDIVLFDGVPAHEVDESAQRLLVSFVKDMGGGFVMIGGRGSFAAGGWRGSLLEELLPVDLEIPDRIVTPETATVFVLDNSGSMNHPVAGSRYTQQQIANEAVALAIKSLSPKDKIGVVVFNSNASELVALQPNGDGSAHARVVRGITSDGGTNMGAGLEVARRMLEDSQSAVRHIVVMTDGQSMNPEALPSLAKAIADRGAKITTIGVGDAADARGLDQVAKAGGGTYYQVRDPRVLPRIFLKAVNIERQPLVREGDFTPTIASAGSPLILGVPVPERLGGISLTRARAESGVVNAWVTPEGDPVLSHWSVGLGQVAAFTSDADRWAEAWKSSESYAGFWTRIVRATARSESDSGLEARTVYRDGRIDVVVNAVDSAGEARDGLGLKAAVVGADGARREVAFSQTAPGRYEAKIYGPSPGANVILVGSDQGGAVVTGATVTQNEEFRALRDRASVLRDIADATGGRVLDFSSIAAARLFDRTNITPRESTSPVGHSLTLWIVVLVLLDLAVRRVAWDRWIGVRREIEVVQSSGSMSTSGLRARLDQQQRMESEDSMVLGEKDAARLAEKARDERRARRLSQIASSGDARIASPEPSVKTEETTSESGLLAAKKRAKVRFEEGDDQISSP